MNYVKKYEKFIEKHGIYKTWNDFFNFCKISKEDKSLISKIKREVESVYPPPCGRTKFTS